MAPRAARGRRQMEVSSTMHRLRITWLALIAGVLLVGLSVSSVFAARPSGAEEGTRGQTIAAFVHELVFGSTDEEESPDETEAQTEEEDELPGEAQVEEDLEGDDLEASAHGQCVADEASDKSDEEYDGDYPNHGAYVREAAQVTCWETGDDEETTDEEDAVLDSGAEITSPDDADAAELSAREQRKADREAAKAERKAAKANNGHGRGGRP